MIRSIALSPASPLALAVLVASAFLGGCSGGSGAADGGFLPGNSSGGRSGGADPGSKADAAPSTDASAEGVTGNPCDFPASDAVPAAGPLLTACGGATFTIFTETPTCMLLTGSVCEARCVQSDLAMACAASLSNDCASQCAVANSSVCTTACPEDYRCDCPEPSCEEMCFTECSSCESACAQDTTGICEAACGQSCAASCHASCAGAPTTCGQTMCLAACQGSCDAAEGQTCVSSCAEAGYPACVSTLRQACISDCASTGALFCGNGTTVADEYIHAPDLAACIGQIESSYPQEIVAGCQ